MAGDLQTVSKKRLKIQRNARPAHSSKKESPRPESKARGGVVDSLELEGCDTEKGHFPQLRKKNKNHGAQLKKNKTKNL